MKTPTARSALVRVGLVRSRSHLRHHERGRAVLLGRQLLFTAWRWHADPPKHAAAHRYRTAIGRRSRPVVITLAAFARAASCTVGAANSHGQLGNGTNTGLVAVAPDKTWQTVSAGESHSCALSGTELYCWGANEVGQAGGAGLVDQPSPVQVSGTWSQVSAGARHTCGLRGTEAYCWGDNQFSQLGSAGGVTAVPRLVGTGYSQVSAGGHLSCGLQGRSAYCWGATSVNLMDGSMTFAQTPC